MGQRTGTGKSQHPIISKLRSRLWDRPATMPSREVPTSFCPSYKQGGLCWTICRCILDSHLEKRCRTLKLLNAMEELKSNQAKCHGNRKYIAIENSKREVGCLLGLFPFSQSPDALSQNYQISLFYLFVSFKLTAISKKKKNLSQTSILLSSTISKILA